MPPVNYIGTEGFQGLPAYVEVGVLERTLCWRPR